VEENHLTAAHEEKILTLVQNNGRLETKIQIKHLLPPKAVDNMDLEQQVMIAHRRATTDLNQDHNQDLNGVLRQDHNRDLIGALKPDRNQDRNQDLIGALNQQDHNLDPNQDLIGVLNQQVMAAQVVINKAQIDLVVLNQRHLINLVHQVLNQIMDTLQALNHHLEDKQRVQCMAVNRVMAQVETLIMDPAANLDMAQVAISQATDLVAWAALEWEVVEWEAVE
jgi:hypothetical protein